MSLRSFYFIILGIMFCLYQMPVEALPPINIRKLYESVADGRYKKDDLSFPQPDEDVLELEQLKQKSSIDGYENINKDDTLPALQKHLEAETTQGSGNLGQLEEEGPSVIQHRLQNIQIPNNPEVINQDSGNNIVERPSSPKPFYGAARLAFGQNPEIFTTASTTTTSTTTTTTSSSATIAPTSTTNSTDILTSSSTSTSLLDETEDDDSLVSELEATKNGGRRSINAMPLKTAESLLKHKDGQYSSFDMAQYVFWTGDEAGVARAVEEFIQQGLMSREHAIKFLKDIRLGIEYLQNSYSNRIFPDHMKSSISFMNSPIVSTTKSPTTGVATTTEKHSTETENLNLTPNLQKALEGIPSLFRLQEMSNARSKDNNIDYDEVAGRMRLADFLYAEYSLEEVIYQLAKVMFSQSLTHGSEQSQRALQRLTEFLESEGKHGRISPNLQKKILDVLLAALSDTLAEHPELLAAARAELGNSFHKLPQTSIERVKN